MRSYVFFIVLLAFGANTCGLFPVVQADEFVLPKPGVMVHLSPEFDPPILKGIKVHPDDPFRFDFILEQGEAKPSLIKEESTKLIKYFLASLTIPEKDLWVNLSPYEKNRVIPQSFGMTEMGRDLLAEDYMLKQITASLIYPEEGIGRKFWKRVYAEAVRKYGTTDIPVNTFNKVWIVPQKAVVYENAKAGTAYVVQSTLKVMLEQDYLALKMGTGSNSWPQTGPKAELEPVPNNVNALGSQIIREVVIPELTKEVNQDKNFVQLRQVYNSLILAAWYKKKIKDSILERVYADKDKIQGLTINKNNVELIYQRYLQAFKKGVYNYIKEEQDPLTQQMTPRKYFSGGIEATHLSDVAMVTVDRMDSTHLPHGDIEVTADLAMTTLQPSSGDDVETFLRSIILQIKLSGTHDMYGEIDDPEFAQRILPFLQPLIEARLSQLHFSSVEEYLQFLKSESQSAQLERRYWLGWVENSLRMNKEVPNTTYFFRTNYLYDLSEEWLLGFLDERLRDKLNKGDHHIRIRHVGIGNGQEIFTEMIYVYHALRHLYDTLGISAVVSFEEWAQDWQIDIDGFDRVAHNLLQTQEGIYSRRDILDHLKIYIDERKGRESPLGKDAGAIFADYFQPVSQGSSQYQVKDEIRRLFHVHPIYLDLQWGHHLEVLTNKSYDITYCQNTLYYLDPTSRERVMNVLRRSQNSEHLFINEDILVRTRNDHVGINDFEFPPEISDRLFAAPERGYSWVEEAIGSQNMDAIKTGLKKPWHRGQKVVDAAMMSVGDIYTALHEKYRPYLDEKITSVQFYVYFFDSLDLVEKRIQETWHSGALENIKRSIRLAQERLGGLVADFIIVDDRTVLQEEIIPLKDVLIHANTHEAQELLDQFFNLNKEILKRGVVSWDPKLENFGISHAGKVLLLDIGGLRDINRSVALVEASRIYEVLNTRVPVEIRNMFDASARRHGFGSEQEINQLILDAKARANEAPSYFQAVDPERLISRLSEILGGISKTPADNAMTINKVLAAPDLKLSDSDQTFLKTIHGLTLEGKNGRHYQFWYDRAGSRNSRKYGNTPSDFYFIREVPPQGQPGKKRRDIGELEIGKMNPDGYMVNGQLHLDIYSIKLRNAEDQRQGIFSQFLRTLPEATVLMSKDIVNEHTLIYMLKKAFSQEALTAVFSPRGLRNINKWLTRLEQNKGVPRRVIISFLSLYQEWTRGKGAAFISLDQLFTESVLGQALEQGGFHHHKISFETLNEGPMIMNATSTKDNAMINKGGIDLTPARMDLQVKVGSPTKAFGDDKDSFKFHIDPAMLRQLQNAHGFVPVIINIKPIKDLPVFLGMK